MNGEQFSSKERAALDGNELLTEIAAVLNLTVAKFYDANATVGPKERCGSKAVDVDVLEKAFGSNSTELSQRLIAALKSGISDQAIDEPKNGSETPHGSGVRSWAYRKRTL